jgi:predicted small lipoprotein YifL
MRRSSGACLLVVAIALSLAACGEDEPSPPPPDPSATDEEQIAAAVNGFFSALVDGDGELACSYLTERGKRFLSTVARRQFPTEIGEAADCEAVVEVTAEQLADEEVDPSDFTYLADDVEIEEGRSKAQVQCEFRGAVFVRRSGGGWLVDIPACID